MEDAFEQLTLRGNNITDNLELKCRLSALECPFNWNLQELVETIFDKKLFIAELETKIKENEESLALHDYDEDLWYKLTNLLLLAYILKMENDSTCAVQAIKKLEIIINTLDDDNRNHSFLYEIKPALVHIIQATKAHLTAKSDVPLLINSIHHVACMSNKELAGIKAVKSAIFLLLGHIGHQFALTYAEEAIELNKKESYWWFLAGLAMGRVRRLRTKWSYNLTVTDKKELEYLHNAIDLKNSPFYEVTLAQTYREWANNAFYASKNGQIEDNALLQTSIDNMCEKSSKLYKSAMDACSNNPRTMIRCALGLLKLPNPYKDIVAAKKVIDNCLELLPQNSYVHHVAARLYERYRPFQDYNKALKHLEIASDLGNFDALMHKITLKSTLYEAYDQYEDLKLAQERFAEEPLKLRTAKEIGAYYLFKKHDIISALQSFSVLIKEDKGSFLECTYISVYPTNKKINLLSIIVDEARLSLDKFNSQEKIQIQNFLDDIEHRFPRLLLSPPTSHQVTDIIKISGFYTRKYRN